MYRQCCSEKSARQQRIFEECMLEAMLQQNYDSISVSSLCRDAGLPRKTFYRLFETKSDVIYAMIDHAIMDAAFYKPDPADGSGEMHRFFSFWKSRKQLLDVLAQQNISNLLTERCILHVLKESPEVMNAFGTEPSELGRETMVFFLSGLFAILLDWHRRGFNRSIDEMSKLVMQLLTTAAIKHPNPMYCSSEA